MNARHVVKAIIGLAFAVVGQSAGAAIVGAAVYVPLSNVGFPLVFGFGQATYTFTSADTGFGPGTAAAVATAGSAMVSTLFGDVTDFDAGAPIDQNAELYTFATYPTATAIPDSATDDFIGLSFTLDDGVHFGYAELDGSALVSYAYETTPDTSITTGATPTAELPPPPATVPEPESIVLLGVGLFAAASTRGRHRWRCA